ncbi:MAG: D-glycero-beta-D-manno-heptose 1-phosphate adenylyltransferase [Fimbriimonadaceae bacterium]|nr:D-glycero-beta-D-manno-heptose 1-phosphate adenylyltransferase [Fimbriimonadaceae bacterium]
MVLAELDDIQAARVGRRLVFTNGVFDILHAGHVTLLEAAREQGDMLIVGLNSDDSVRRLGKGPERPINPLADRMRVVGALRCVDGVLSFEEDTPVELIRRLKPDVHVKGGDYRPEDLPETAVVEASGGRVVIIPLLEGRSTTSVVRRMQKP